VCVALEMGVELAELFAWQIHLRSVSKVRRWCLSRGLCVASRVVPPVPVYSVILS
jgi:hypothetical protein